MTRLWSTSFSTGTPVHLETTAATSASVTKICLPSSSSSSAREAFDSLMMLLILVLKPASSHDFLEFLLCLLGLLRQNGRFPQAHAGTGLVQNVNGLCEANFTQAAKASSVYFSLWCSSYFLAKPWRMVSVSSFVGSGTFTGWKRRSSLVLLNVLPVLLNGSGTNDLQLATRQRRLHDVSSIDGTTTITCTTRTNDGVDLVDHQNDLLLGVKNFFKRSSNSPR
eukprot:Skav235227  [mRNA]  locus=scaffold3995:186050:195904:- [translate_table: standard]